MLSLSPVEKERLVRDDVQRHGWSIIYVMDEDKVAPSFAYSVGLFESFRHPEIIVVGLTESLANPLINTIGFCIGQEGVRYEGGRYYGGILEHFDCYMHAVRPESYEGYVGWDLWYYDGGHFPLLQCVYPCGRGHFPWDPAARALLREGQPIIGGLQGH